LSTHHAHHPHNLALKSFVHHERLFNIIFITFYVLLLILVSLTLSVLAEEPDITADPNNNHVLVLRHPVGSPPEPL